MATRTKSRFWRICRVYFRRFRIAVWLVVLALVATFVYLNQVGLPGFVKEPLLENLRARGLDLQFSRLRLRWYRGLVAENVRFGRAGEPRTPQFTIQEGQLRLNHRAMTRLQLQVDSLMLRQGRLIWPVSDTNQAPRELAIENIQTELRFLPNDEWSLDHFTAAFAGARIKLSGAVTNASALRDWELFQSRKPAAAGVWPNRLRELADLLERIHFSAPPELALDVRGDARDLQGFTVRMTATAPGAATPWGTVTRGRLGIRLYPPTTNGLSRADLNLEADRVHTRWARAANVQLTAHLAPLAGQTHLANGDLTLCAGRAETQWASATNLQLVLHASSTPGETNLVNATLALHADQVRTRWGAAANARFNAQWAHALTNAVPLAGDGRLVCDQVNTKWAEAKEVRLNARLAAAPAGGPSHADASWAGWAWFEPYLLDWDAHVTDVRSSQLAAQEITGGGSWRAPELILTNLAARFDPRRLAGHAALDVATRALSLNFLSDLDPPRIAPLLLEGAERWLAPFSWEQPPELHGEISLVLPAWTNRPPDWRAAMQSTIRLAGGFNIEHGGAYRGVRFSTARSQVIYSNRLWRLPDFTVTRPEGRFEAALESDERTKEFHLDFQSGVNVGALRPALGPAEQRVLDLFKFTQPPLLDAEIQGCWDDLDRAGVRGQARLTNFTFRGQAISGVQSAIQYTNRFLQFIAPRVQCDTRQATADGVGVDFIGQRVYLTNGFSTVEPMVVARAIGPHVARAIEPYRFDTPPIAKVHGTIPLHGEDDADLHFELEGGPFHWWRFHVPRIHGRVHWLGQHLALSNVNLQFYGGSATGEAAFDFHHGAPTDYRFALATTNTELQTLMGDLFARTYDLRGALSGKLVVTNANTADLQTWNGFGDLQLQNGLIWDIPVFGVFSDVLNGMSPGLGSSRASAGTCTFGITNGVIRSADLDIRATGLRLQYKGTVDFEGNVKARVEAGLMRDVWLVGPVVSTVLWPVTKLFEYKVGGTLGEPKAEPVYLIPKVMLLPFQMPFHPWRTLKGLLPEDSGGSRTNKPVLTPPKGN